MSYPYNMTLQDVKNVTHDTKLFRFDKPDGFTFSPGQATEIALDQDAWRDEGRPFTMASQPQDEHLDFVIKIYPDHDGMTEQMADLSVGDKVLADDPFGAITDHGAGLFLAAGAGITPFIPILMKRAQEDDLSGCQLIFANKTEQDIILRDKWEDLDELSTVFVTDADDGLTDGPLGQDLLSDHIDTTQPVYICGPGSFVDDMRKAAKELGVKDDDIITEDGW